jgi:hypothetical protein
MLLVLLYYTALKDLIHLIREQGGVITITDVGDYVVIVELLNFILYTFPVLSSVKGKVDPVLN